MPRGRREEHRQDLFAVERAPRLVLRFAIVLSLSLAIASALILLVVRSFTVSQAERAATRQAGLVAATLLQREVRSADFARVVPASRRGELDELFRRHLVAADTLSVSLVRADGLVTYSTDHRFMGGRSAGRLASEAARGTIVSRTSSEPVAGAAAHSKVLETYTPVAPGRGQGAAAIVQSYDPIEHDARRMLLWVGGVLEGLLIALFAVFVPLLSRVTRRIGRQIEKIHYQGFYDDLTGLANRAHLRERFALALSRAAGGRQRLAVLLVDLDHFREINDTLGHGAGDSVLREVGARLRGLVGPEMLLSRPLGDEFAIVLQEDSEEDLRALADRVRAAVELPIVVDGVPLSMDATAGIALYPRDGADVETLLRHAEVAMHAAKAAQAGVLFYSPEIDPHDPEQLVLVSELRDAASRGELAPHFQPKVALETGRVTGFEALAYWQHPTRGLLPPGAFIPVAERTGAIRYLSRAMVELAVRQVHEWERFGGDLTLAVNLAAVDLLDLGLPDQLEALVRKHGVSAERLCLEITEGTIMADVDRARSVLDRLDAIGFRLSVDDFGTGYSSLAYLKTFPVHEVKIDRSLVSGIVASSEDRAIVRATVQLAHALGLQVVAEGVESGAEEAILRELRCDYVQGYLYARPLPAADVEIALAERRPAAA